MQIQTCSDIDRRERSDALVLGLFQSETPSNLGILEERCVAPIKAGDFEGTLGQIALVWGNEPQEKRIILVGLGKREELTLESIRKAYGAVAKTCLKCRAASINIVIPGSETFSEECIAKALLEGLLSASYSVKKEQVLEDVLLITNQPEHVQHAADRTLKVMRAVRRARDLINANADEVTPERLAEAAKELQQEFGRLKVQIKDKKWLEEDNWGLLLAVSRAASVEPRAIVVSYVGNPTSSDHTVLVGKGITYDTGGLKLKSSDGMLHMRSDMSGGAICLGVMQAISSLGLRINVSAVIPSCENAIGPDAYKLGDVYKARSGHTVEITNTDAEGRLILADALSYAVDVLEPSRIIDIGTLTGSIEAALGNELMGLFSNSDLLANELFASGQRTHERSWIMPLYEEYADQLLSDVADIKNANTAKAGSILCATFLKQFVGSVPWAHFDIASVAFTKEAKGYLPKLATGVGIRLLVDYLEHKEGS